MSSKKGLSDVFAQQQGSIHLGGIDAIVRLALDQVRTDARRGLKTGMFVSGYRGSPVGMLDAALIRQQRHLLANNIHFVAVAGFVVFCAAVSLVAISFAQEMRGKDLDA